MATAAEVVNIALAEVGYKEKASNANLDLKDANAGSNNWTKYARDLYQAGYYNGNKNGYAWCDVFVDWCFFKAFGKTEGQMIECQTSTLGADCSFSASYYKAQKRYDKSPKVGDQVFFQQNGKLVHTGLVVGVTSSKITCVEGNASNQVKKTSYSLTNAYVAGFGHPKYDKESTTPIVDPEPVVKVGKEFTVKIHELSTGCKGPEVKNVQRILFARGCKGADGKQIKVDGEYGANTKAAVVKLQMQLFPGNTKEQDGVWGAKTATAAFTSLN